MPRSRFLGRGEYNRDVVKYDGRATALRQKKDPLAAAVGAYTLLRFGELDRLHNWTENLKNWFKWLPDGLTIRAEHLAQLGKHEEALDLLLELPARGVPIFSEGLSISIDRLGLYLTAPKQFSADKLSRAHGLMKRLRRFAAFADFNAAILSYTGLDPTEPEDRELDRETIRALAGIDLDPIIKKTDDG